MGPEVQRVRERLPDAARDLKLNLGAVLGDGALEPSWRYGVAIAVALSGRAPQRRDEANLAAALLSDAESAQVDAATLEDARAAAALMGMNNVYYRFRHFMSAAGSSGYAALPARLRMQRFAQPAGDKRLFELMCLAVSAVNGCETCVVSHEHTVRETGVSEAQVHDAIRIAATVHGAQVGLAGLA